MSELRAIALHARALERLRVVSGFAGLGFGLRETAGRVTGEAVWRVYVRRKRPLAELSARERVPAHLLGLSTDVVKALPTTPAAAPAAASGPAPLAVTLGEGAAIANHRGVPGSLGCIAGLRRSGELVLLSSYHVLFGKRCQRGDPIWWLPPEPGAEPRPIGRLLGGKLGIAAGCSDETFVDAATGSLDEAARAGLLAGAAAGGATARPEVGAAVRKRGAASGDTAGLVVDTCYPDRWYWEYRSENAPRQILVRSTAAEGAPFSRSGDSGAVLRDHRGHLIGLLWGCNARGEGVASPIDAVALSLGLQFAGPAAEQGE